MKKIVKSIITWLLVLTTVFSTTSTTFAATTVDEDYVDQFVDGVFSLTHKDEFTSLLVLFRGVNDVSGMSTAYSNAFGVLGGSQQDRLTSFGATVDAVGAFAQYMMNETYSEAKLNQYLNDPINGKADFKASIMARVDEFRSIMETSGASISDLDAGFTRMDKIFGLLSDAALARSIGISLPFLEATAVNGTFTLNRTEAVKIVTLANSRLEDKITDSAPVMDALQKFVDYYNSTSGNPRSTIYGYLNYYGFVNLTLPVDPGNGGGGNPGGGGIIPGGDTTVPEVVIPVEEDVVDEEAALGLVPFLDLGTFSWALDAITRLYAVGVVKGKDGTTFDPNGAITRAEFSVMLVRLLDAKNDGASLQFTDFTSKDWFYQEVIIANKLGYVKGLGNRLFNPKGKITREEMATMIGRVLTANKFTVKNETILNSFTDKNDIHNWAYESAKLVVQEEIITGRTATTFVPGGTATRAEAAVMLYRLSTKIDTIIKSK